MLQIDPYDVVDPRDVLKELSKFKIEGEEKLTYDTALLSKKWSDRKAALAELKTLASYPRLASGR